MAGGGLQEVDTALLARLHDAAMQLTAEARRQLAGEWREGLDARAAADATLGATLVGTRLMEAMNWLLTAQAVAADGARDPGPAAWRSGTAAARLPGRRGELAVAVDRLYRRIVEIDAEVR